MSIRLLLLMLLPTVAGVALGYLLGGRLAGFGTVRIRAFWLLWAAAGVQLVLSDDRLLGGVRLSLGDDRRLAVGVPVFALVLTWLAVNVARWPRAIRIAGVVIMLGASLNGLAIALNGRMPYDPEAAVAAGLRAGVVTPKNEPAGAGTRLALLGDVLPVRPLRAVVSLGDLLIGGGTGALVVCAMRRRRSPDRQPLIAREVNHDPHPERAARRLGDLRAGGAGHPALHGRRADDRGKLTTHAEPGRI